MRCHGIRVGVPEAGNGTLFICYFLVYISADRFDNCASLKNGQRRLEETGPWEIGLG